MTVAALALPGDRLSTVTIAPAVCYQHVRSCRSVADQRRDRVRRTPPVPPCWRATSASRGSCAWWRWSSPMFVVSAIVGGQYRSDGFVVDPYTVLPALSVVSTRLGLWMRSAERRCDGGDGVRRTRRLGEHIRHRGGPTWRHRFVFDGSVPVVSVVRSWA